MADRVRATARRNYLTSQLLNNLPLVLVAAVVLWAFVDARPAIAVGICVALGRAIPFATGWYDTIFGLQFFLPLAWGTLLALLMVLRLHRQAGVSAPRWVKTRDSKSR